MLIAANWKANRGAPTEAGALARELRLRLAPFLAAADSDAAPFEAAPPAGRTAGSTPLAATPELLFCPPATALESVLREVANAEIQVGVQDVDWHGEGAYTGALPAVTAARAGARYAIVGHSERRAYFGESDAEVQRKLHAAIAAGLRVILCVGETAAEADAGLGEAVVFRQLGVLGALSAEQLRAVTIAYEPVWAIGTGRAADAEQAAVMAQRIRAAVSSLVAPADGLRVLYGGSVKAANAGSFFARPEVDGALVGGASLDAAEFTGIAAAAFALSGAPRGGSR